MGFPPSHLALVRSSWMAYQEHLSTDFRSYINILINLALAVFSLSSISPWSFGPATLIPIFKGTYSIERKELQMQIWKSRKKFHSYFPPFFTRYLFQMELIKQLFPTSCESVFGIHVNLLCFLSFINDQDLHWDIYYCEAGI